MNHLLPKSLARVRYTNAVARTVPPENAARLNYCEGQKWKSDEARRFVYGSAGRGMFFFVVSAMEIVLRRSRRL